MDGATSYDVLFDGTPHRTTEPSKDIEGLEPDTEHTYAVWCNNADGESISFTYDDAGNLLTVTDCNEKCIDHTLKPRQNRKRTGASIK